MEASDVKETLPEDAEPSGDAAAPENDASSEENDAADNGDTAAENDADAEKSGGAETDDAYDGEISRATLDAMKGTPEKEAEEEPPSGYRLLRLRLHEKLLRYRESGMLFKACVAFVTGAAAASVIVIAGMFSERNSDVVFLRAAIGFIVSYALMFFLWIWMEKFGIPMYVSRHEELQQAWMPEAEEDETTAGTLEEEPVEGEESPGPGDVSEEEDTAPPEADNEMPEQPIEYPEGEDAASPEEENPPDEAGEPEEPSFSPMTAENLDRVEAPPE